MGDPDAAADQIRVTMQKYISALTGYSGSLGDIINNETSYHLSGVLGAAICIAALALVVELALSLVQRLLTPRGLKVSAAGHAVSPLAPAVTELG